MTKVLWEALLYSRVCLYCAQAAEESKLLKLVVVPYEEVGVVPYEEVGVVLYEEVGVAPYEMGVVPYEEVGVVP